MDAVVRLMREALATPEKAVFVIDHSATISFASAAATALFADAESSLVGRELRSLLDESNADLLNTLPMTRAGHEHVSLVHDTGFSFRANIAITAITNLGVDAYLVTIEPTTAEVDDETARRYALLIEQYCHSLTTDLINKTESQQVSARLQLLCQEVGEMTNSHTVSIARDRPEHEALESIGRWTHPDFLHVGGASASRRSDGPKWREALLSRTFVVEDVTHAPYARVSALKSVHSLSALLSTPFAMGDQRGVLVLTRRDGPHQWRTFDRQLAQAVSPIIAAAIHWSGIGEFWRSTFARGSIGFSIRTRDGHLRDCNQQYRDLYGLRPDQLERADLIGQIHPDDRDKTIAAFDHVDAPEHPQISFVLRVVNADGQLRHIKTSTIVVPVAGQADPLRLTMAHEAADPDALAEVR